jgi:hypothetical protein
MGYLTKEGGHVQLYHHRTLRFLAGLFGFFDIRMIPPRIYMYLVPCTKYRARIDQTSGKGVILGTSSLPSFAHRV